jgi:hypothetical protein
MGRNNAAVAIGLSLTLLVSGACTGDDAEVATDVGNTAETKPLCFPLHSAYAPTVSTLSDVIYDELMDRTNSVRQSPTSDTISRWLLKDLTLRGTYEDKIWAALLTKHMAPSPPYHPVRADFVDAMHQNIVASLTQAASDDGAETDGWGQRLALDEASHLSDELAAVYLYLRGRAADGRVLANCPATLPADTGIEEALESTNVADNKLGQLAELLHVRRLNMPAETWDEGPNEWNASAKLVHTGGNTESAVRQVAQDAMTSIAWFFEIFENEDYCNTPLEPLVPESLVGACSSETRLKSSWDPTIAKAELVDMVPSAKLQQEVQGLVDGLADKTFYFQGYDVGAELFGYTFIVIAPEGGTTALVVEVSYSHS